MAYERRQKGISAVEFALAFPLMFLIFYGVVTYALVFLVQHTLSNAVAESARALLRYQSMDGDTVDSRITLACQSAQSNMQWLIRLRGGGDCVSDFNNNGNFFFNIQGNECAPGAPEGYTCFYVTGVYDYKAKPLIPRIYLLPIPSKLNAYAETQVKLKI